MLKRLVVAASVSTVALIGVVPTGGASAEPSSEQVSVKAYKAKIVKPHRGIDWDAPGKAIDWDAPAPAPSDGGGFTTQRIDWD